MSVPYDTLTINGSPVTLGDYNAAIDRCVPIVKGGIPELHFSRILGPLTTLPDIWSAAAVTLNVAQTTSPLFAGYLIFTGDVVGYVDRFVEPVGWVREYRALGLRNRADYIPVTDAVTLTDTEVFNLPGDDPNFIGARAGLTVGQILTQILTQATNAAALYAAGVGGYTSTFPWTLPALTVSDLSALTITPPWRVSVSGERILQALEGFVQTCHPNHWLHVQPDGVIRFLDARLCTENTLTIGLDPRIGMPSLTRDYSDCYSQVTVRGGTLATPVILQTLPWPGSSATDGGLQEAFAWGSYDNAAAKANWTPADYNQPSLIGGSFNDEGSLVVSDLTHVVVTSSDATSTWSADFWAQGNAQGEIYVYADLIPGVSQLYAARIVANTPLVAAGSSTLTLDRALPSTGYNSYKIWGLAENASVVYRKYKVVNPSIASAMLNYFPYPVAVHLSVAPNAATLTSTPVGFTQIPENGVTAPYSTGSASITVDPVNGYVYFDKPTAVPAGTTVVTPYNVLTFLAIATGALNTTQPVIGGLPGHDGTLYTVEGVQRTKIITVRDWTDQSNSVNMTTFASEFLQSVHDVIVEGTIPYYGMETDFLLVGATGQGVSIAGQYGSTTFPTGWEGLNLPVVSVELSFNTGPQGTSYTTNLQLSNRRGRFTADAFLRPSLQAHQLIGGSDNFTAGGFSVQSEDVESGLVSFGKQGNFSAANQEGFDTTNAEGFDTTSKLDTSQHELPAWMSV